MAEIFVEALADAIKRALKKKAADARGAMWAEQSEDATTAVTTTPPVVAATTTAGAVSSPATSAGAVVDRGLGAAPELFEAGLLRLESGPDLSDDASVALTSSAILTDFSSRAGLIAGFVLSEALAPPLALR